MCSPLHAHVRHRSAYLEREKERGNRNLIYTGYYNAILVNLVCVRSDNNQIVCLHLQLVY